MLQLWHLGFPVQHTLTSNKACHTQHTQNHETIQEKVNSQLCQCCRTGSKSNSDCAWAVNLLGEKMRGFEYNIHILSRWMFFSSSALDVDEFTSVHISVCGNILQMNTHSRLFQKPLLLKDVFLISASLIYSLQVRSVTVLCVCDWILQSLAQSHQPLISFMFQESLCCFSFRQSHSAQSCSTACLDFSDCSSYFHL